MMHKDIRQILKKGDIWLKEVNEYIYKNKLYLKDFIENNLSMLKYHFGDATYLAWGRCKWYY